MRYSRFVTTDTQSRKGMKREHRDHIQFALHFQFRVLFDVRLPLASQNGHLSPRELQGVFQGSELYETA